MTSKTCSTINFFSKKFRPQELQKLILSELSTKDLIKTTSSSKYIQAINIDLLFARIDKLALQFQVKTVEKWFKQLFKDQALDDLSEKEKWIKTLSKCKKNIWLINDKLQASYLVHCEFLLQYLQGKDFTVVQANLSQIINEAKILKAPIEKYFTEVAKEQHDELREIFITSIVSRNSNEIDALLNKIEAENTNNLKLYDRLLSVAADFNKDQLTRAIQLCFDAVNYSSVEKVLLGIMKHLSSITSQSEYFFEFIVECLDKDFNDKTAFLMLLESNNTDFFKKLIEIITIRINKEEAKGCLYQWIDALVPYLREFDERLISGLIKNPSESLNCKNALRTVAKQLTFDQIIQYSQPLMLSLEKKNNRELIKSCETIAALLVAFLPPPPSVVQKLINLANHKMQQVSLAAMKALLKLKPSFLVIQNGILEKYLTLNYEPALGFNYLIQAVPLLSSEDISDDLIKILIDANYDSSSVKLRKKALFLIGLKFNEQQLEVYISCIQNKHALEKVICLEALPVSLLRGKIDLIVTKYTNQLTSKKRDERSNACQSILSLGKILTLFPYDFLTNFIKKLHEENYYGRGAVYNDLPKIISLIKENDVEAVYNLFFLDASRTETDNFATEISGLACECIIKLVPRLPQPHIMQVKEMLIKKLEHEDLFIRSRAYSTLTQIAPHTDQLNEIVKILAAKAEVKFYNYRYTKVGNLVKLITSDTAKDIASILFKVIRLKLEQKHIEACFALIKIANSSGTTNKLIRAIIANLIEILPRCHYQTAVLNGLVMLEHLMTVKEFEQILKMPATSFTMISTLYVLKESYDKKCQELSYQKLFNPL